MSEIVVSQGSSRRIPWLSIGFYLAIVALGFAVPQTLVSARIVHLCVLICIYGLLVYGLGFLYEAAGQLSVAHGALWGIGAYTTALLTLNAGWTFWICLPTAMVTAALFAGLLGYPSLRVKGHYFLIVTFAFAEILQTINTNWRGFTNGDTGLVIAVAPPPLGPISLQSRADWLVFSFALLVLGIGVLAILRRLPFGRRLSAIRENETLARAAGVNTVRDKVLAFMISGAYAGAAGACWAYYQHYVNPHQFDSHSGIELILMLLIGGIKTTLGPIVGVIVAICLPDLFGFSAAQNEIALGVAFIAIILLMPEGIVTFAQKLIHRLRLINVREL